MDPVQELMERYRSEQRPETWQTVLSFIQELGFDQDEYFHLSLYQRIRIDQPIWDCQNWIAVFWVNGTSEGYYVHVENRWNDDHGQHAELILLGKFWDWRRTEEAVQAVQCFVNCY